MSIYSKKIEKVSQVLKEPKSQSPSRGTPMILKFLKNIISRIRLRIPRLIQNF